MKTIVCIVTLFITGHCFGQSHVFVFLNKRTDVAELPKPQLDSLMQGHLANINRLHSEGKLVTAGPFDGGGGIFLLQTNSVATAQTWISTDPAVAANRWRVEMFALTLVEGSICAIKEPYEMVTYDFIRFTPVAGKPTAYNASEIISRHYSYQQQLVKTYSGVVSVGRFEESDGGYMLLKEVLPQGVLDQDPGVQEGLLQLERKKLWIARGTFCEN